MTEILRGLLGMVAIVALAFAFSNNRRQVNWRLPTRRALRRSGLMVLLSVIIFSVFELMFIVPMTHIYVYRHI